MNLLSLRQIPQKNNAILAAGDKLLPITRYFAIPHGTIVSRHASQQLSLRRGRVGQRRSNRLRNFFALSEYSRAIVERRGPWIFFLWRRRKRNRAVRE